LLHVILGQYLKFLKLIAIFYTAHHLAKQTILLSATLLITVSSNIHDFYQVSHQKLEQMSFKAYFFSPFLALAGSLFGGLMLSIIIQFRPFYSNSA
jgi:hypothetical protein